MSRSIAVAGAGVLAALALLAGCATTHADAIVVRYPRGVLPRLSDVAGQVQGGCASKPASRMELDLVQADTNTRVPFGCASMSGSSEVVESKLVALVSDRREAGARATKIVAVAHRLGVQPPFDRAELVWNLASSPADSKCDNAANTDIQKYQITLAQKAGETPAHWLAVEMSYIAGACPGRVSAFFAAVDRAGQHAAVATVRDKLG